MKAKTILIPFALALTQTIGFVLFTQLSIQLFKSYNFSKIDVSWGISLTLFYILSFLVFLISNILFTYSKSKVSFLIDLLLLPIIAFSYWYNSLLVHPYRTTFVISSFIIINILGNTIARRRQRIN